MGTVRRKRQRASRRDRGEANQPIPEITEADLELLVTDTVVRDDCEHASTRAMNGGMVLVRCAVGASLAGACPRECPSFRKRRAGGFTIGLGAG